MKKIFLLCVCTAVLSTFFSFAQIINETGISHVTLNQYDQEQADHWDLKENEWLNYKKYMELEGKYFYEKVDPLTVMALITKDPESRNLYIQKQIAFERQKIGREVALANDAWRIQRAIYGAEKLVDFQKLPWMDETTFDRRTIKQEIPTEPLTPANQIISPSTSSGVIFENSDELWVVMDQSCDGCFEQVKQLTENQPLNVVIVSLIRDGSVLQNWVKDTGLNRLINAGSARLSLYDPLLFPYEPKANSIFQARLGHVLREIQ